ncbi:lysine-specific demethylase JMJ28 isoform X2 [Cornus florida]|uniref:lysine-specific demethylase JMJ28 isoform X2 n=1 Tax=Cornus florida TaxID=4283 RepID=UPI00289AF627|nr:lysine-specific demethylase JMJ28 isoform X2 [Cornus florida]
MKEDEALPDNLRCRRTDGRQWRCTRRVMDDKKLCEIHYIQGRRHQHKGKDPESLKLQRKPKNKRRNQDSELQNLEIRARKRERVSKKAKRSQTIGASEALDEALKKMKLKRGDLQLELIREFLKRQVEKKKERESERSDREVTRELPYGLMAISPSPPSPSPQQQIGNAGPCNVKLGLDSSSFPRRCFRSKNIEPIPIGSFQIVPCARKDKNLKKRRRKNCHWCRKSSYRILIKCSTCRKEFFCTDCITERNFDKQEVRMSCPVCRGTCSCRACSKNQSKDPKHKDLFRDRKLVDKLYLLHYLIFMLLPVLEQINKDQRIELEIEAKIKGKTPSEVQIQHIGFGNNNLYCCNCKSSIVDFHRKCTTCSYKLCLSCSLEICRGSALGNIQESLSKNPNRRKACMTGDKLLSNAKHISISRRSCDSTYLASSMLLLNWKACDDGSISCPPVAFGGCGDGLLDLRCVFPFNWTKELEVSAEVVVSSSDFPGTSDVSSCCSPCRGMDHKVGGTKFLQGVVAREDSNDNLLYYPAVQDLCDERIEHFQKHWGKGHPVIVRNVIEGASDLSWDPVVMFCTYLEKSSAKPQSDKDSVKATNCLDWCEIEIGVKQIFMGSLEGRTHANVWREMLKFKGWLSSHIFQEQFPAHYSEIIRSLPLQEYMNPTSGLLNVAVKLPQEIPKPDLGPCIYISYGGPEELMQGDFLTKLCYESYDVVNILAHATDVPISTEQLSNIKKLMKKYKARDHREAATIDKKETNEVKGESPLHSENTEELGLQDMIGEGLDLPNGVASVSLYSGDSHKDSILSVEDKDRSHAKEHDPEFDSEASILLSGTIQSSEESDDQNSVQDDIESAGYSRKKLEYNSCGAQWDIFRRQDAPKLIEYLRRHSNEFSHTYCFPKQVVHPILDQCFFLDAAHKMRLKDEFNIEPWSFEQHLGEAVIIPAGCPYQIRKLKSCVNVVLDFISPENAKECINLIDELRLLPVHHKAKAKMLEVKKMTLYGISAAIKEVCKPNTCKDQ